jgi:predicted Co/Zn/Cd cation transporter (cation efflux family)
VIPTLLLVGLVVGAFVHDRASLVRSAIIGATVSVLWGLGVGVANGSVVTFFGGVAFALANVLAGTVLSAGVRSIASRTVATPRTPLP